MRLATSIAGLVIALASGPAAQAGSSLEFDMPAGWIVGAPSSSMRVAEFTLPGATRGRTDASLVVYYFGGSGGTVEANLARWLGQMTQPDGSPSAARARRSTAQSDRGLKITMVDVAGTYVAEVTPGSTERFHEPGYRLLAAVVETPGGPYFVKLVGPDATVTTWYASVQEFLKSMRLVSAPRLSRSSLPSAG